MKLNVPIRPLLPLFPNLSQRLQKADADGDQPVEAVIWEAESLDEELQLRGSTGVLHAVIQLSPAQDVDVTAAKERI